MATDRHGVGGDRMDWVAGGHHRICRFCKRDGVSLVHYGTRAYAHTKCLITNKGEEFLLTMPVGLLGQVEVFQVSEATREAILARMAAGAK